jgi:pilus assembly protein CpaB
MSGRTVIILILGILVAFTAVVMKNRMAQAPAPVAAAPVAVGKVLVAKRDILQGGFVQQADVEWKDMGDAISQNPTYIHEGAAPIESYNGAVVRRTLRTGDPIPQNAITRAGDGGFMSAVLEPGMRAVSISVNPTSGNAGFISPGDRVDLIVTHRIRASGNEANDTVVSETFVNDCRVVAIDQMLDNPENKAVLAKTVTVEVTPAQAAQVAVAAEMGKISMALRSLSATDAKTETKSAAEGGFMRDSDISRMLDKGGAGMRVQVIRGDKTENIDFDRRVE